MAAAAVASAAAVAALAAWMVAVAVASPVFRSSGVGDAP